MSYVDVNTPVIEKITLPSGNTYFIADREIRDVVDVLSQTIAGGISYIVAWDGTSTPVVADIPAGITVVYNGTSYTGTLSANSAQPGAFYLVKSATQTGLKITSDVECTVNINTFRTKTNDATSTTYTFEYTGSAWSPTLAQYGITVQGNPAYGDKIIIETPSDYNNLLDKYDEYVPIGSTGSKEWEKIGDTQIDLSNVVTGVTLNKQTDTVIGTDATFTVTQPTINLELEQTGDGPAVVTGLQGPPSLHASDSVAVIRALGSPSTKNAIGANSTFTVTQPTVALATDTTSGTGKVQVATGISSVSASGDSVNAVTGYASPTSDTFLKGVQVTAQPTVSLTANTATATGRIQYVQSQGSATTTKLSAAASGGAVSASGDSVTALTGLGTPTTQSAVKSVTPATSKLVTTSITGVSGSVTASKATAATSQTTADGTGTASQTNTDWLKGVSVSNGILTIGAATMDTQTTTQFTFSDVTVPKAAAAATTVATGSTGNMGSGSPIVTGVSVGETFDAVTGYASPTTDTVLGTGSTFSVTNPTVTISSGSSGDVTVATGIGSATTRYLSASASGVTVGADGTGSALTGLGDPTTDTVLGTGSTITVTPTTTYLKGSASGANVAWNSKDTVTAVTDYASPTTTDVAIKQARVEIGFDTEYLKATATGANTAWNNKDSVTVLKSTTDVNVTKGS